MHNPGKYKILQNYSPSTPEKFWAAADHIVLKLQYLYVRPTRQTEMLLEVFVIRFSLWKVIYFA